MYRKIIFDLDGVITSESAFWDSAALTVAEFMGFPMDTPAKLRETLFCRDRLIRLVKNRGVNSNWDLVYLFCCFFDRLRKKQRYRMFNFVILSNLLTKYYLCSNII